MLNAHFAAVSPVSFDLSDEGRVEESLRILACTLLSEHTAEETLGSIAGLAQRTIPGCDTASVTVMEDGRPRSTVSTSDVARAVDQHQYDDDDGPCLTAVRQRQVMRVDSYAEDQRWPRFATAALRHGVHSSLSVPLMAGTEPVGALNLYSETTLGFADAEPTSTVFATQAAITLANSTAFHRASALADNLGIALGHRDTIGQAKGILMAQRGLSPDEAFDVLRRASQHSNRKVYDLAVEVVERRSADELDG